MRTKILLSSLVFLTGCVAARPSSDEREVLATVQAFFDVIASRDAEAGARLTIPEGVFVSVRMQEGQKVLRHFDNAEWLRELPSGTSADREAFVGAPRVLIEGDVAVVWGRYVFEVDGEHSHVGVDAFNLLRTVDGWKIAGGAYSVVR